MWPLPLRLWKKLAFMMGTWRAADHYEKTPFIPNGGSGSGVYKTIPGPGRLSILTDYQYQGPQGESSGHQVLTWDVNEDRYVGYLVTSTSPGFTRVVGDWEGANFVLSGRFRWRGKNVEFKQLFSDINAETMTLRQYNALDGAPAHLFGTTNFTKTN
jgi:Protein of unknown function (DUF1579)